MDERIIWQHIKRARATIKGENQLAEYVARLDLAGCVEILAASTVLLPSLARNHERCRVEEDEERSYKEVIRTWTLHILSGLEGG